MWWSKKKTEEASAPQPGDRVSFFAADSMDTATGESVRAQLDGKLAEVMATHPRATASDIGLDDCEDGENMVADMLGQSVQGVSEALFLWYATQGFIGHQMCAVLSQHWLINKVCLMPGKDAIRNGFEVQAESGEELSPEAVRMFAKYNKRYAINRNMIEFVRLGRIFGIRIAFCKIKSDDPEYYEKPFNPDGIMPGSYRGIVQVDPYWTAPIIDATSTANPDTVHFYEPTYWLINGKKYHRSHLIIFKTNEMPDFLKPAYYYGGMPIPQLIMERVYAAERTANEAPNLALSKRTTVLKTDVAKAMANESKFIARITKWVNWWSNFGVKVIDREDDEIEQFDTSLTDFDSLIMTQYQIVAAAGEVPATKLLGTTPKGFNATGEYDEASYHESLSSLQELDLTPLLERHLLCVMRSVVAPSLQIEPIDVAVNWAPLDTPTLKEYAEVEEINSRTALNHANIGSFDQYDIRNTIIKDKRSMFGGLMPAVPPSDPNEDFEDADTTKADEQAEAQRLENEKQGNGDQPIKPAGAGTSSAGAKAVEPATGPDGGDASSLAREQNDQGEA